jgi:hypothetical protein
MKIKCTNCEFEGEAKTYTPGSILIELILWFFFLIPGLIYSIWRIGSRQKVCPRCGWKNCIKIK